jgi:hypothetical protein
MIASAAVHDHAQVRFTLAGFRAAAMCVATLLLLAGGAAAQSSGAGNTATDNIDTGDKSAGISSNVKSGPDGTTLGTARSIGAQGDTALSKSAPYTSDPSLLRSNKDIERALKSICRGC